MCTLSPHDLPSELLKGALVGPVDHLGIAVKSLEAGKAFYGETLGLPLIFEEEVETEKVRVAAYQAGETRIELLESTDPDGPIGRFVAKRGARPPPHLLHGPRHQADARCS